MSLRVLSLGGDIFINVDPLAANAVVGGGGNISLASTNNQTDAYVQIGHGGTGRTGAATGNITIGKAADVELLSGGTRAYTQIGHGGATTGSVTAGTKTGNVQLLESHFNYDAWWNRSRFLHTIRPRW